MLPVIICDDQDEYRNTLEKIIKNYILIEALDMDVVLSTGNGSSVLDYISQSASPFLYFLDVDLKDESCSGIDLAQKIRKLDPRGFIVFITVHSELSYMTFQYCIEAMDYIVKDYPETVPERVRQCLFHAKDLFSSTQNSIHKTISIPIGEKILLVKQDDILCLQASQASHKITVFTHEGVYEQATSLKDMVTLLGDQFFFCHKSCIINTTYIKLFDKKKRTVTLENNMKCPVSFRKTRSLSEFLSN